MTDSKSAVMKIQIETQHLVEPKCYEGLKKFKGGGMPETEIVILKELSVTKTGTTEATK
jgi:hypothetical protein